MTREEAIVYFQAVIGPAIIEPVSHPTGIVRIDTNEELLLRRAYERALRAIIDCPPASFKVLDVESLVVPEDIAIPPVTKI